MESPFLYCERIARRHYENFPVGWFIPGALQKYIFALYAFARTADDFADEKGFEGKRLQHLEDWEKRLEEAVAGRADHPLFDALSETFERTSLPPALLKDLLTAFRWDVTKSRYADFPELLEYCRFSANPIGRAVLILFGYSDPQFLELSDKICTGIQLVNHWQDIAVDWAKDRIYIPQEDLKRFEVQAKDLGGHQVTDSFRSLLKFEMERTRTFFHEGEPLLRHLGRRLRWQVELMWEGPLKVLDRIEKVDYDVFGRRPALTKRDLVGLFLKRRLSRGNGR